MLNLLKSNLVLRFHNLCIPNAKIYYESTIGLNNLEFEKFKFFRVDYIRYNQNGFQSDRIIFELKFLNVLG
ncbi:hypothetical protein [Flavobacterium psychrotolerans]|uniref:hypothetical protein n=1 Tax=Flavobacterium psychrotolerans TaxID=2169410 RepID=UPI0010580293|nr:hypothetical protein [Flavobacterium psychrotolerans]